MTIIPANPDFSEMVTFSFLGFGVVCAVLLGICATTLIIGSFFKRVSAKGTKAA